MSYEQFYDLCKGINELNYCQLTEKEIAINACDLFLEMEESKVKGVPTKNILDLCLDLAVEGDRWFYYLNENPTTEDCIEFLENYLLTEL